ncbi:amino acid adenylation domain-containing protein [Rhizomonospora bruguierae]|uniref:amino acid adenylation domain-containing protein n=1 Tax=Rhizomonospora bruguierae TaxID=1581705 RepID=UPI001BCC2CCA|nr:amino acid adenylation domain-containing protein [Micromonospora sp. NBRC 107566]
MTNILSADELIADLRRTGVQLWEEAGRIRYRAPKGVLTPDRLDALRANRDAVIASLRDADPPVVLRPDPDARYDPFPLTDVQAAYLLGRGQVFEYGGVGCHVYLEITYPRLDAGRAETAWNRLVERHDMLRVVIEPEGYQRVLPTVAHLVLPELDLRGLDDARARAELAAVRAELDHAMHDTTTWPVFALRLTQTAAHTVLHLSMDFLVADWTSIWLLLGEFEACYAEPARELPPLEITFRDHVIAERGLRESSRGQRHRDYWWSRLDDLPAAPELPVLAPPSPARFARRSLRLDTSAWERLKRRTVDHGLTPSVVVLAAYAAVIQRWCGMPRFTLNLTVLNRQPVHPQLGQVVGDFTSVDLLAIEWAHADTFAARAAVIGAQLFEDLDHSLCSGIEVMRELARRRGRDAALMPIVFTSAIGLGDSAESERSTPPPGGASVTQTPQVFIDCQTMDDAEGLLVNWDVRQGVFPTGVTDDMFAAFEALLRELAGSDTPWQADEVVALPRWQSAERRAVNDTAAPLPSTLLHEEIFAQAARTPQLPAVIDPWRTVGYGELAGWAAGVARALRAADCGAGHPVAIVMDKGVEQVAAVLGVLLAGAVFVPVDAVQPPVRRRAMIADAGARHVLTQSWLSTGTDWPAGARVIQVDTLEPSAVTPGPRRDPDDPAYVIYTSGSTGRPKGVVISHRAAANTVGDINRRFSITAADRVLGVSNLGFDLSIYDIFGPLSVGGALVYPQAARRADPSHWAALIAEHEVTVWNSVPALMQMLTSYLRSGPAAVPASLRLALLSGDWIPVALPDEIAIIPGVRVVSLGGATEAAIWSIHHPITGRDPAWPSVPYGVPLANQGFRVLDPSYRDCPVWVAGELFITGAGLAQGYLGDPETTAARFVTHPRDGERLYRTGDRGRYRPGGEIEFLGREDTQVKIRGHRVELGEVEAALCEHPAVTAACVVVDGQPGGPRALFGVVEPARRAPVVDRGRAGQIASLVHFATGALVAGVDRAEVDTYVARLDDAVLSAMTLALRRLGFFPTTDATHDGDDIAAAVDPRHRWLLGRWLAVLADAGHLTASDDAKRFALNTPVDEETVARTWQATEAAATGLGLAGFLRYLRGNTEVLPALLVGEQDPVALLLPGGQTEVADALYRDNLMVRYLNRGVRTIVERIATESAGAFGLRVLEVGAGTGATTEPVLEALGGTDVDYLFTDVSRFFLPAARARFGAHPGVRFGVVDIDLDMRAQGLAPNSFDVVLAAGVLENSRDPGAALRRLGDLVTPGGWMVLTEPTREHPWILASQAFMMTPPEDAARRSGASYLDRDQWLALLAEAGAVETVCLPDDEHVLAPHGLHLFAARFKADRVPVRPEDLHRFLVDRLPEPMIPRGIQIVDRLPLSTNGKVDRAVVQGWLPTANAAETADPDDAPADDLETALAAIWSDALATGPIGRVENLVDRGADSLIMARTVGRLREEIPAAADTPFDTLLRHLLNSPTIADLARFLRQRARPAPDHADAGTGSRLDASIASLVRFRDTRDGPVRVMFHAGMGTMECFRPLAARLTAQHLGPVVGIVIEDPEMYCALEPSNTIERLADHYTDRLLAEGYERFQLIGYCVGGLYATEVARRLLERGIDLDDLILVSSHPVLVDVEEDLMLEALFIPNLGLSIDRLGFGPVSSDAAGRAFAQAIERHHGRVPVGALGEVGGDRDLDAVAALFRRLGAHSQEDRFTLYANAASRLSGEYTPPEMVSGMFRVLRHSFLSTRFRPAPYTGDIRFLLPQATSGFAPGMEDATMSFWREICLGALDVVDIDGDHFTCIEEPLVADVAAHIARPLRTT